MQTTDELLWNPFGDKSDRRQLNSVGEIRSDSMLRVKIEEQNLATFEIISLLEYTHISVQ